MRRLIEQSGYATVRMDKPGVGESQGNCAKADFNSELEGWRAAFAAMGKYEFMDAERVFVLGLSNGGGFGPVVSEGHAVRGFIAASSWGRTWYEHMLELERRRLTGAGKPAGEVNEQVKAFGQFYELYLNQGMTPGEVLEKHPEWKGMWYDEADGQYGRPAAFYQQLQKLNLGEVWEKASAPVLVIRGAGDTIMSGSDAHTIFEIVNRVHAGRARFIEVPGADHLLTVKGKLSATVVPAILQWMSEQAEAK